MEWRTKVKRDVCTTAYRVHTSASHSTSTELGPNALRVDSANVGVQKVIDKPLFPS